MKKESDLDVSSFTLHPSPFTLQTSLFTLHSSHFKLLRVGPEGIEPTLCGLKVRRAACYTTTLEPVGRMRFNRRRCNITSSRTPLPVVARESNSAAPVISRRWATSPRLPTKSGWSVSNRRFCVPGTRGFAATLHPESQSERRGPIGVLADRCPNPRSLGPRPSAMPGFATF